MYGANLDYVFFIRGWDWWAKRYDGYLDFLFAFLVAELRLFGFDNWADWIFTVTQVLKPVIKNGKIWYEDGSKREPVAIAAIIGFVFIGAFNYYYSTRNIGR